MDTITTRPRPTRGLLRRCCLPPIVRPAVALVAALTIAGGAVAAAGVPAAVAAPPLVTPDAPVEDPLLPAGTPAPPPPQPDPTATATSPPLPTDVATPAPPVESAPASAPASTPASTPASASGSAPRPASAGAPGSRGPVAADPTTSSDPAPVTDVTSAGPAWLRGVDWLLLAAAVLVTALLLLALRERIRVPQGGSAAALEPARGYPAAAAGLLTAPGTAGPPGTEAVAVQRRFDLRADVLVLPVLAVVPYGRPSWLQCHDLVDAWLWHESWLRAPEGRPEVLEADGLLVGEDVEVTRSGRLLRLAPAARVAVLPVSEGLILSRPAETRSAAVVRRWRDRIRVWRAHAPRRAGASVLSLQALVGPPLALALPVLAILAGAPAAVVAASFAPLAVGVLSAVLRWAALDDLDRSTTIRVPVSRGVLLILTGPLHATLTWWAAVTGLVPGRDRDGDGGGGLGGEDVGGAAGEDGPVVRPHASLAGRAGVRA